METERFCLCWMLIEWYKNDLLQQKHSFNKTDSQFIFYCTTNI